MCIGGRKLDRDEGTEKAFTLKYVIDDVFLAACQRFALNCIHMNRNLTKFHHISSPSDLANSFLRNVAFLNHHQDRLAQYRSVPSTSRTLFLHT